MRLVLDANVLVAAFGFSGICRAVVEVCIDSQQIVLSEHMLGEVHRCLCERFGHSSSTADDHISLLRDVAEIVEPIPVPADACRDPDDLPVLGTVLAGKVDCLVTGDKDLLDLREFHGCPVLSPRRFWESLR